MKVRSLVSEFNVDKGELYAVSKVNPYSHYLLGVDVIDNVGDIYFLLVGEYEIVEE